MPDHDPVVGCGGDGPVHLHGGYTHTPNSAAPFAFNASYSHIAILHPTPPGEPPGLHVITVHRAGYPPREQPSWEWDGDPGFPTLHPSIRCTLTGWHGYLRRGRFDAV